LLILIYQKIIPFVRNQNCSSLVFLLVCRFIDLFIYVDTVKIKVDWFQIFIRYIIVIIYTFLSFERSIPIVTDKCLYEHVTVEMYPDVRRTKHSHILPPFSSGNLLSDHCTGIWNFKTRYSPRHQNYICSSPRTIDSSSLVTY